MAALAEDLAREVFLVPVTGREQKALLLRAALRNRGRPQGFDRHVLDGALPCASCEIDSAGAATKASLDGAPLAHQAERREGRTLFRFRGTLPLPAGARLRLEVAG